MVASASEVILAATLAVVAVVQSAMVFILLGRVIDQRRAEAAAEPEPALADTLRNLLPGKPSPDDAPMPEDVVTYCDEWLDELGKESCRSRARMHYRELRDWSVVLSLLAREDGEGR